MTSSEPYILALWDDEAVGVFSDVLEPAAARVGVQVKRLGRAECEIRLRAGLVDMALVPAVHVLQDVDAFDVYPAAAVSSWRGPHATVRLPGGLDRRPETICCTKGVEQEALMSRIVLREHYAMEPEVVEASDGDRATPSDTAVLSVGELVSDPGLRESRMDEGVLLDLGQEWYELTNYPMVWGLFVSRAGESDPLIVSLLKDAAASVDADAVAPADVEEMVSDATLRFRLDDLATASLTELGDLLYFYRITEEVPAVRFASDPDAATQEQDDDYDSPF